MLRYFRFDRAAPTKPLGRRLAIQPLEERLALSTVSSVPSLVGGYDFSTEGGFVPVDAVFQTFDLNGLVVTSRANTRTDKPSKGDVYFDQDEDDFIRNTLSFERSNENSDDLQMKTILPPELFPAGPDGGMVGPIQGTLSPEGLFPVERPSQEAASKELTKAARNSVEEESIDATVAPTKSSDQIGLGRGREISFKVATFAPPQNLVSPDPLPWNGGSNPSRSLPLESKSPAVSSVSKNPEEPIQGPVAWKQQTQDPFSSKGTLVLENATSKTEVTKSNFDRWGAEIHGSIRTVSVQPAGIGELPMHRGTTTSPTVLESEEIHSQVFADWRRRDLLVLPLIVTLLAGPRLLRLLRMSQCESQTLPTKRIRQPVV